MKSPKRWVGLFGGLLGMAIALALIGFALQARDLQTAANVAQLVSVVITVAALVVPLWAWFNRNPPTPANAKETLAEAVYKQWTREAQARGLDERFTMPVRWRLTADETIMHLPDRLADVTFTGTSTDVARLVEQFRTYRRLVILGGPGSGKTTLSVQLLLALLEARGDGPVPVFMSLTGWNVDHHEKVPHWVAGRLRQDYGISEGAAASLAHGGVLLVLDGLDELPEVTRRQVIAVLSRYNTPLILTCRTEDYRQAVQDEQGVLSAAGVIEPEPLTPAAAVKYLRSSKTLPAKTWEPVLTALQSPQPPAALAGVVSTPLGLWLVRTTCRQLGVTPEKLLDPVSFPTAEGLRGHLFTLLIPALVDDRPPVDGAMDLFRPRHRMDPRRVTATLAMFAYLLDTVDTVEIGAPRTRSVNRDFRWWRLSTVPLVVRGALTWPLAVVGGLLGAAMGTFGATLGNAGGGEQVSVLAGAEVFAVIGGLIGAGAGSVMAKGYILEPVITKGYIFDPVFTDLRSGKQVARLVRHILLGLVGGAVFALVMGVVLWLLFKTWTGIFGTHPPSWLALERLADNIWFSLSLGLSLGVLGAISTWLTSPSRTSRPSTPYLSWRAARDGGVLRLVTGAIVGASYGSVGGVLDGRLDRAVLGGLTWMMIGLAVGLFTERRAWLTYLLAAGSLARHRLLPLRLMTFLDDAHRLGLLRAVGPIYQFRHADLQDYLAAQIRPRQTEPEPEPEPEPAMLTQREATVGGVGFGMGLASAAILLFTTNTQAELIGYSVTTAVGVATVGFVTAKYFRAKARQAREP